MLNQATYEDLIDLTIVEAPEQDPCTHPNPDNLEVEVVPFNAAERRAIGKAVISMGQMPDNAGEQPHDYPRAEATRKQKALSKLSIIGAMFADDPDVLKAVNARGKPKTTGHLPGEALGLYLSEIGRFPILSKDEEIFFGKKMDASLAIYAKTNGESPKDPEDLKAMKEGAVARQIMISSNLRLLVNIANRLQGVIKGARDMEKSDLIAEGYDGLITAVEKYDWRKGFKLSTYATWWIEQSIHRGVENHERLIRIPNHVVDRIKQYSRAQKELEKSLQRDPTYAEIAERCGVNPDKVEFALYVGSVKFDSLDGAIDDSNSANERTRNDVIADTNVEIDKGLLVEDSRVDIERLFSSAKLTEREIFVLSLREGLVVDSLIGVKFIKDDTTVTYEEIISFDGFEPMSLKSTSKLLGLSGERIRQIQNKAKDKIRECEYSSSLTY